MIVIRIPLATCKMKWISTILSNNLSRVITQIYEHSQNRTFVQIYEHPQIEHLFMFLFKFMNILKNLVLNVSISFIGRLFLISNYHRNNLRSQTTNISKNIIDISIKANFQNYITDHR